MLFVLLHLTLTNPNPNPNPNTDRHFQVENMSSNHQLEIQQILRDAAVKISKFKEIVDSKQASLNVEAQMEKLTIKHETEKKMAIEELQKMTAKFKEREAKIASEFTSKFEALRGEVSRGFGSKALACSACR